MQSMSQNVRPFMDKCLIYFSSEDKCWIAHSLRTDQIGTGECIIDALTDLFKAVQGVIEEAKEDKTINIFRNAPEEIQELSKKADKLPREMYEIAFKKAHGEWPESVKPVFQTKKRNRFTTSFKEPQIA